MRRNGSASGLISLAGLRKDLAEAGATSLEALDFIDRLAPPDINWILASSELVAIPSGESIVREGVASEHIFVVTKGGFDVCVKQRGGTLVKVSAIEPGQLVGEISWLDGAPPSATVTATESSSAFALKTQALDRKLLEDAGFAFRFYRSLSRMLSARLRRATQAREVPGLVP